MWSFISTHVCTCGNLHIFSICEAPSLASLTVQLNLPSLGSSSLFSVCQGPIDPFHQDTCTEYTWDIPDSLVSILPLEVVVQNICIQQSCSSSQELMATACRFQLQDEEAQAEHGSHFLQFTGTKL